MKRLLSIFKESTQRFEGQEDGEEVVMVLRRHRFVLYLPVAFLALMCLVPIIIFYLYGKEIDSGGFASLSFFVSSLWYIGVWLLAFYFLSMYALNTVIITNKRVIDNDQLGFFDRKVSELHMHRIQDVAVHTQGVIETFLDFGTITVQTAAVDKQFVFPQIPNPEAVKDTIMQVVGSQYSGVKQYVNNSVPRQV
jgi:uncharacterized membrane protein YdbT with pleckstrin-like domain